MSLIKKLSFFGICFAFVVIALGAWTRLVDAGLGCPDWPGCYGFVVFPTTEAEILIAENVKVEVIKATGIQALMNAPEVKK